MSFFFQEITSIMAQGGIVLWMMLGLSLVLYTTLASSWWGVFRVKQQIGDLAVSFGRARTRQLLQDEVELFELKRLSWVQRRLPVLSVLIALAPLAGLLGTVAGMLNTFSGMSAASTGKPIDSISSGISQALITTQVGLLIAIPAALLYALLKNQCESLRGVLEKTAVHHSVQLSAQPTTRVS